MSAKKTEAAEPARDVLVEVVKTGGIKLPCSNHRLGRSHRCALTQDEADRAVEMGLVKIIGLAPTP